MTRRTLILLIAMAAMIGFYLYDRANSTETVIASTVLSVDGHDASEGPESWLITVTAEGKTIALELLQARPDLAPGDTLCVARITRMGQDDVYRRANSGTDC